MSRLLRISAVPIGLGFYLFASYLNFEFLQIVPEGAKLIYWQFGVLVLIGLIVSFGYRTVTGRHALAHVGAFMCSAYLFAVPVQTIAMSEIGVPVSVETLISNWAPIRGFIPGWMFIVLAVVLVLGYISVFSALKFALKIWSRWINIDHIYKFAVLVVIASIGFGYRTAPERWKRLNWDPVALLVWGNTSSRLPENIARINNREIAFLDSIATSPISASGSPNIVIFMADSLNVDVFSEHYRGKTSVTFLDALHAEYDDVSQPDARSTCAGSVCGVMSTFLSRSYSQMPSAGFVGLGNVLGRMGYKSRFILASDHSKWPLNRYQAFLESQADTIFDFQHSSYPVNSDRLVLEGLEKLDVRQNEPNLIFVFFFSSHMMGAHEEQFELFSPQMQTIQLWRLIKETNVSADARKKYELNYRNKLSQLDHYMSEALAILKDKGVLENSIFVLTSDHGEALGRLGKIGHGILNEDTLRIPMVLADKKGAFREAEGKTLLQVDIAPTLLTALNIDPPELWEGQDIGAKSPDSLSYHESGARQFKDGEKCRALHGRLASFDEMRLTICTSSAFPNKVTLFDLTSDPQELSNIWNTLNSDQRDMFLKELAKYPLGALTEPNAKAPAVKAD